MTKRKGANTFMASMRVYKKMRKTAGSTALKAAAPKKERRAMRSKHDVSQDAYARESAIHCMHLLHDAADAALHDADHVHVLTAGATAWSTTVTTRSSRGVPGWGRQGLLKGFVPFLCCESQ